jgi:glutamine amidotransferase
LTPPVRVAVFDYGMGNIRSVSRAAARCGADVRVVPSAAEFDRAGFDGVILPGQGHFGRCVDNLRASGLDHVVMDWCQRRRPFLGICVGMQILVEGSEEGGSIGLGLLPGRCVRVGGPGLSVPHMGWDLPGPDQLEVNVASGIFSGLHPRTRLYFCHSYGIRPGTGTSEVVGRYGVPFVSALEKGTLWAVQFHPEKSSAAGLRILANFLAICESHRDTA